MNKLEFTNGYVKATIYQIVTQKLPGIRAGPRRLANDWKKHPEINFAKFLRTPFYRIRPGDLTLY